MNENTENQAQPFLAWFISANLNAIHFAFFLLFLLLPLSQNKYHWHRLSAVRLPFNFATLIIYYAMTFRNSLPIRAIPSKHLP